MYFIIVSDVHGNTDLLKQVLDKHTDMSGFFFLGDGLMDVTRTLVNYPDLKLYAVAGNCDLSANYGTDGLITISEHRILYTHGNLYNVKLSTAEIVKVAKQQGVEIVLFGHTHHLFNHIVEGVRLFNPGALGKAFGECSYGMLTITEDGELQFEHVLIYDSY